MSENTRDSSSNHLVLISSECTGTPTGLTKSVSSTNSDIDSTPRIIFNELIVSPLKSMSVEKLDELSSLEQEIAKMHHVDDANLDLDETLLLSTGTPIENKAGKVKIIAKSVENEQANEKNCSSVMRCQASNLEEKLDAITSGETALEHEDLIAVLKGLDNTTEESHNNSEPNISIMEEGVTIEGEGEYQIMEVIDEDSNATEDCTKPDINAVTQTLNKTKIFGSTTLTAQEERALALEQMEGLKTKQQRRRKQDIKPIKQVDSALDLVSALEADWSENDEESVTDKLKTESKVKLSTSNTGVEASVTSDAIACKSLGDNKTNSPLITSVVVIPSATASGTISTTLPHGTNAIATANSNSNIKDDTNSTNPLAVGGVIETTTEEDTQVVNSQTGFRRTRIIKRKIIWDPDAPETTFSYAKLVKSNNNLKNKTKTDTIPSTTITKGSTTITPIKKEGLVTLTTTTRKIQRPPTPKSKKSSVDLNVEKANTFKMDNSSLRKSVENDFAKSDKNNQEVKASSSPTKRRSQTPVSNGSSVGIKKKKGTELDRLMGDEGAVNMLNSLERIEAALACGESKANRLMMRSRAATISEKLPRKETTPPSRTAPLNSANQQSNKGKRTPKSRASSTWDYVYKKKKQDFDDSLIIRRRSNSSYSSTTSQNRLSLDGAPTSITNTNENSSTKSDELKCLPATASENALPNESSLTLSHNNSSGNCKNNSAPPHGGKSFEFAKPENKKSQKRTKSPAATLTNDMKKAAPIANKRSVRSPGITNYDEEIIKATSSKSPTTSSNLKDKRDIMPSTISDVVVKKSSKVAQILFSTNKAKLNNTFTIQMLNKLVDILDKLASDPDCHVVVIGTNDIHFCQGIDITDLTTIATEKRKNYAANLATSVKNYLKTLASYPKPLIAGVNGNVMNLGVIQLALFDVVIASDKTTFETPYAKMGQVPEGYCIWHNMNKIRGSFKTKLFWLCEKIQSTEAALAGLVNKLTSASKVNDDALGTAKRIACLSAESYRVMKKTVINSRLDIIVRSLDEEFDAIIKQWTSKDCVENMKKFVEQGHF